MIGAICDSHWSPRRRTGGKDESAGRHRRRYASPENRGGPNWRVRAVAARRSGAIAERFINRELSWLEFNRRVLLEASNTTHPLLEQVRFISISANNLDEFFMVRVAGLRGQERSGVATRSDDGLTPTEQLTLIRERGRRTRATSNCAAGANCARSCSVKASIIVEPADLTKNERKWLDDHFFAQVFPVSDAAGGRSGPSFPFYSQSRFHLALDLENANDRSHLSALVRMP